MILVTGGTGLVGSHLLYKILQTEKSVKAIYRSGSNLERVRHIFNYYANVKNADAMFSNIEWIQADLMDIPALELAFLDITRVYHCAALVSFQASSKDLRKINIEGTANIVNLCIANNIKKLCFISSVATMDPTVGTNIITENFTWHPEQDHSNYAITKHGAETEVWRGSLEGLKVIIINPGVIIGPGFWNSGSGQFFSRVQNGLIYHFPKVTGFVGVLDVANLAELSMNSTIENEQFIAVAENLSFKLVLDLVAGNLQKPKPSISLQPWMIKIGAFLQTIGKLFGCKKTISWRDSTSLFEESYYQNDKVKSILNFKFTSINKVIEKTSEIYKKDLK